jgi:hypothetical protein
MEKINRTGEVVINRLGQECHIIEYHNNKDISVDVIDRRASQHKVFHHQRYHRIKNGLVGFNAARYEGEPYEEDDAVQGRAIGCSLMGAVIIAVGIVAALFIAAIH